MDLVEFPLPCSKRRAVRPTTLKDMPLFKHCAGGASEVYVEDYEEGVKHVLEAHGIYPVVEEVL